MHGDGRSQAVANRPDTTDWSRSKAFIRHLQPLPFTLLLHRVHLAVSQHDSLFRSHAARQHRRHPNTRAGIVDMAKPITQLISAYRRLGQAILHEMDGSLHITCQVEMFGWRAHRNHDELIATDAPDGVAASEALLQLGGYATEKLIPCLVAIGIVDEFETIQVNDPNEHVRMFAQGLD